MPCVLCLLEHLLTHAGGVPVPADVTLVVAHLMLKLTATFPFFRTGYYLLSMIFGVIFYFAALLSHKSPYRSVNCSLTGLAKS